MLEGYGEVLMKRARRLLVAAAAVWLSCQLATVTLTPIAVWVSAAGGVATGCTFTHGADSIGPMHHKSSAGGTKICVMQSVNDHATVLFVSIFALAAPVSNTTL